MRLTAALANRGHETVAIVPPKCEFADSLSRDVECQRAAMRGIWDFASRSRIRDIVAQQRPGVVVSYMGRATRLTRLRRDGPVHVARLGGYYDPKGYRHADAWVGNARGICDHLVEHGFAPDRVFHIGNFVEPAPPRSEADIARLRRELGLGPESIVVLCVARLHPNKGIADLLEAFASIEYEEAKLVVVGDGPLRAELETAAVRLGLAGRVTFPGWRDDVHRFYSLADVFVCPSRHEPLGNVILEAWSHALPVVSTRTTGAGELVNDGADGRLVDVGDAAGLAEVLAGILATGPTTWRSLGEAGARSLEANHSETAVVEAYVSMFARLAALRP